VETLDLDSAPAIETYYKVSASDVHENESGFALLAGEQITGIPGRQPVTMLAQNEPNPFGSNTTDPAGGSSPQQGPAL
jgi:hypothetical protein